MLSDIGFSSTPSGDSQDHKMKDALCPHFPAKEGPGLFIHINIKGRREANLIIWAMT